MKSVQIDTHVLVDQPRPTTGYLVALCVFFSGPLLVAILNIKNLPFVKGVLFTVALGLFLSHLYRAYRTRYVLSGSELSLSNGFRQESIPLASIVSITPDDYLSPFPVGKSRQVALYCNRYRHQLKIQLPQRSVFLSPSQPEQFKKSIMERTASIREHPPSEK
jgi:hypothetical protein